MSSRMLESTGIDDCGRLISSRRLGRGGSWASADATKAAPRTSIARVVRGLIDSQIVSLPRLEVHLWPGPHAPEDHGCEGRLFSLCCLRVRRAPSRCQHLPARNRMSSARKPVAVVVGATSKWQSDGRNTKLAHGRAIDDSNIPVGARWGVGGAVAQKFAQQGHFVVLTTRSEPNAAGLAAAIREQGGDCTIVELDLSSQDSIASA